jgi:hypothetical protein
MSNAEYENSQLQNRGRNRRGVFLTTGFTISFLAAACFALGSVFLKAKPVEFVPANTAQEHVLETLKAIPLEKRNRLAKSVADQLQKSPLDLTHILQLAALASASGDEKQSEVLTLLAANRSHDDASLQANALQIELKHKDFTAALNRIDNLFNTAPQLYGDLLKTLVNFAQNGESFPALIKKLAEKPSWRPSFIPTLAAEKTVEASTLYAVFSELRKIQSNETPEEMHSVLDRLIKDQQFDKAYFMWVDSLTDVQLKKAGTIFDGGFDLPVDNQFFSWTIIPQANVEARTVQRGPGSTDMVYRIDFEPGRTPYAATSQVLRLPSGPFKFTGEAKSENLKTSNGLVWRVTCLGQNPKIIGESPRAIGSQPWARFSVDFLVPEEDCAQQILRLDLDAPTPLDTQVEGSASFDSFAIDPVVENSGG